MSHTSHRYFKAPLGIYNAFRGALDHEFGHPNGYADTCLPPMENALQDENGDVYIAVLSAMMEWPVVAVAAADLLASGDAIEISSADYQAIANPISSL